MDFRQLKGRFICNHCNEWSCPVGNTNTQGKNGHLRWCKKKKSKRKNIPLRQLTLKHNTYQPRDGYNPLYYGGVNSNDDVTMDNLNDHQNVERQMQREDLQDFEELLNGEEDEDEDMSDLPSNANADYNYVVDDKYLLHQRKLLARLSKSAPIKVGHVYNSETDRQYWTCMLERLC
jgi:hypothetical protein